MEDSYSRAERRHAQPQFEGYTYLRTLATTQHTKVLLARRDSDGREVAIKRFHDPNGPDAQRAEREQSALQALEHENIVRFIGVASEVERVGCPALVMDYVEGTPLSQLITRAGRIAPRRVADIGAALARGLAHMHEKGLIHRDVKPDNVIVSRRDGRPVLVDLGLVKALEGEEFPTAHGGNPAGTWAYMAPEQFRPGGDVTTAVDVYSLGATLFQGLTGVPPWTRGRDSKRVVEGSTTRQCDSRDAARALPDTLRRVLDACLRARPEERPIASQVGDWLESWLTSPAADALTLEEAQPPIPARRAVPLFAALARELASVGDLERRALATPRDVILEAGRLHLLPRTLSEIADPDRSVVEYLPRLDESSWTAKHVFSLGATLHYALTGRGPGEAHAEGAYPDLHPTHALARIVRACMRPDPGARPELLDLAQRLDMWVDCSGQDVVSLARVVSSGGRLSVERALEIMFAIGANLAQLHPRPYRVLTPSNVLLGADRRSLLVQASLASVETVPEDAPYLPSEPERDTCADVYAFGATLFFVLTGRPPAVGSGSGRFPWRPEDRIPGRVRRIVDACALPRSRRPDIATVLARLRDCRTPSRVSVLRLLVTVGVASLLALGPWSWLKQQPSPDPVDLRPAIAALVSFKNEQTLGLTERVTSAEERSRSLASENERLRAHQAAPPEVDRVLAKQAVEQGNSQRWDRSALLWAAALRRLPPTVRSEEDRRSLESAIARTWRVVYRSRAPSDLVDVGLSPEPGRLAYVKADGEAIVIDSGELFTASAALGRARRIEWDRTGDRLAIVLERGLQTWTAGIGFESVGANDVTHARWGARRLAVGDASGWTVLGNGSIWRAEGASALGWDQSGDRFAVAFGDHRYQVWGASGQRLTLERVGRFRASMGRVNELLWSPRQQTSDIAAVGSCLLITGRPIQGDFGDRTYLSLGSPKLVQWSPTGEHLALIAKRGWEPVRGGGGRLCIVNVDSWRGQTPWTPEVPASIAALAWTGADSLIATDGHTSVYLLSVRARSVATYHLDAFLPAPRSGGRIALCRSGLVVQSTEDGRIRTCYVGHQGPFQFFCLDQAGRWRAAYLSPDGRFVAALSVLGVLIVWDTSLLDPASVSEITGCKDVLERVEERTGLRWPALRAVDDLPN